MKTRNNAIKIINSIILLTGTMGFGFAQDNIMSNPGMDGKCIKNGYAEIIKTETWTKAKDCHKVNAIPTNYMGYQNSTAGGGNYAGIIAYYDDGANNATDSEIVA